MGEPRSIARFSVERGAVALQVAVVVQHDVARAHAAWELSRSSAGVGEEGAFRRERRLVLREFLE